MKAFLFRWSMAVLLATVAILAVRPAIAQVNEYTLDNGLRLITSESHTVPIVAVDVWVKAGTRRENTDEPGVAHFLEHLIFQGTINHPDEESVDGAIEDLGGTLDAATSYDWAHFYTEVPSSGTTQAIALLADVLQHAQLKPAAVEEERPIIMDEIQRDSDDPITALTNTARSMVYTPGSAYARPITGTLDQVRGITRDQIVSFYQSFYVPNNMTVVVTGDFDTSAVEKVVADQFGSWKRSTMLPDDGDAKRSAYEELLPGQSPIKESVSQKESDESYMVMAFNAPSVTDTPDAWEMDVLLTLLGQGGNNRLNSELKLKQHLVNTISADYLTQKDEGVLTVSVSMPTSNVDAVQTGVLNQISLLRDTPVSDAEVQSAINSLKASYLFDVDTDSGHADSLGFYDSIDSYMYDVNYLSRISVVTPADVQRIAQKYLDPNSYTVVMQIPPADASTAKDSSAKSSHLIAEGMVGSR